jgi:O-antigen ligase
MLDSLLFSPDRRPAALVVGGVIGAAGGLLALLVVLLGPTMAFGFALGLAAGYYALTDLHGALYVMIAVIALIPFGKVPFNFSPTPTLLDGALGAFLVVYAFQWMTGQRRLFRSTPMTPIVIGFTGLMVFAYLMGLRHAPLDSRTLRNVAEMVLSLMLIPVLVDVMRDSANLRRAALVLMVFGTLAALIGIGLWLLPDMTAEALLNRLGRLDYPVGGVIRYRETNAALLNERAIGTWIDPNAFGGFLLIVGAVIAPQVFSEKPVTKRLYAAGMLATVFVALFLTDSRGSMLSLGVAFAFVAMLRYRRLLLIMMLAGVMTLFLPFTQRYIDKLEAGFTNQDVETQMRLGEYKDALTLIGRHPVIGAGFSGTPEIDLYFGVANTYLTIASHAGFAGLAAYLLMMASIFIYSAAHYRRIHAYPAITDVWLGLAAAIVGVLVGGIFDHFYFKIDLFHATMTLVWIVIGLQLAAVRLAAMESAGE